MIRPLVTLITLLLSTALVAQNQYPEISNLSVQFDGSSQLLTINYDLFDAEGEAMEVQLFVSDDDGLSYTLDTGGATGDVGSSILSGNGKTITWDATGHLTGSGNYRAKVVADDLYQIDIQSIVDQVDSNLILSNLEFIEGIRHRNTNPDHLEEVKDTIEQRFLAANLETFRIDFPFSSYTGQNIIGHLEGNTQTDTMYIIDGHFDSVHDTPGADDNGSAVAGMLEALRVLAPYRFEKTLRYIGFDLEEEGLLGAFDYTANSIPDEVTIKGVFNMEMIGYYSDEPNSQTFPAGFDFLYPDVQAQLEADDFRGNFITNIGDGNSVALMDAYNSAAATYVPDLKVIDLEAPNNWIVLTPDLGRSDHAPFWLQDIPALMITDGSEFRNPNYHTENDVIETLDFTFMSNVVKAVVGAVAEEAGITHSTSATDDFSVVSSLQNTLDCVFQISPIPANENLNITFEACNFERLKLQVFDVTGKLMLNKHIQPAVLTTLNLEGLEAGLYLLRLSDGEREVSRKVLVE